ncbi:ABC transporter ATP-binding protein [Betaproteobacteria bacterium]|nr:ABC transporter ATP-binding protein [Betaproteobacteria bacterium]GHU47721.1 ABC transporter ATP-binding protein [Betaproteobacteria bacterium]
MSAVPLLQVEGLEVRIGTHLVCRDLNLHIASGDALMILGKNGAGKSTLLATLAGLRAPYKGRVLLSGQAYAEQDARTAARRRSWLGQQRGDPFAATVLEAALAGRHPHLGRWQWEGEADTRLAQSALAEVGLQEFETRDVQTLSGGERQRLAIASLLTQATPLMLLDEPLTHLDLNHQIAALEILRRRVTEGAAFAAVLHEPGLAWRYGTQALLMYGDGETEIGAVDPLLTPERLSRLYGHPLMRVEQAGRVAFVPV